MAVVVTFQGVESPCQSIEDFGVALDSFDEHAQFELWLNESHGPAICMLRNGESSWLMYMRHASDAGLTTVGNGQRIGTVSYRLSNGQTDEYPATWCVPVEECYKALAYFFVNAGQRPDWLTWRESQAPKQAQ